MINTKKLLAWAKKNGWIVIEKDESKSGKYIRFLAPSGNRVNISLNDDGTIQKIYP